MNDHELDSQSSAFRGAQPADLVTDEDMEGMVQDGDLILSTDAPVVSVDAYEAGGWDSGRESAKTLEEAKVALAARVQDPRAPDRDASAYDGLEGS